MFVKNKAFFSFYFYIQKSNHLFSLNCCIFLCSLHVLFSHRKTLVVAVFELILKTHEFLFANITIYFTFPSPVFPSFLVQLFYTPSYCLPSRSKVDNVLYNKLNHEPDLQRDVPVPSLTFRGLPGVRKVGHLGICVLKSFSKHRNAAEGKKIRPKAV